MILEPWIWAYCRAEADNSSQGSGLCLSPAQRIREPAETQWVQNAAVPKPDPSIMPASWHWVQKYIFSPYPSAPNETHRPSCSVFWTLSIFTPQISPQQHTFSSLCPFPGNAYPCKQLRIILCLPLNTQRLNFPCSPIINYILTAKVSNISPLKI